MKNVSLATGVAIILIANAFALIHAVRNRAGTPDAELTLTNRELSYYSYYNSDDDSGVTLNLRRVGPAFYSFSNRWLDQQKLQQLGFDCSVNPAGKNAVRFYQRQRPRQAFVALEYDGPAWLAWLDEYNRATEERARPHSTIQESHLLAIDADLDAGALRVRHPDRSSIVIVPAVIGIGLTPYPVIGARPEPKEPPRVEGTIWQIASSIHVPRPYSDAFPRRDLRQNVNNPDLSYKVRLRYGSLLEPWVTGVDFHP